MADEKGPRIISEKKEVNVPKQVTEERTVQEPKTVMEKQTIEVPKTVMEERTIQEERTVMEKQTFMKLISASCKELDGYDIVNPQGDKLGSFDDIMLDLQNGRIAYAVLSVGGGGIFGMNKKMIAVPWEALSIEGMESYTGDNPPRRMILNVSKDDLDRVSSFERGDWPAQPDRAWLTEKLYTPYGYHPWWETKYSDTTGSSTSSGGRTMP